MNLQQGDCLELLKTLPDNSVDMVLTDPPYALLNFRWDKSIDFKQIWQQLNRITKDDSIIALFGCEPFSTEIRMSNFTQYKYGWYWQKDNCGGFMNAKRCPLKMIENIMIFAKKTPRYNPQGLIVFDKQMFNENRDALKERRGGDGAFYTLSEKRRTYVRKFTNYPKNLIAFSINKEPKRGLHPTQKPVSLLEYLIKTYTHENETVLDFTMGSGSTGVACINTGRNFIGFELDEHYFGVASDRINKAKHEHETRNYPSL